MDTNSSEDLDALRLAQRLRLVVDRLRRLVRQAGLVDGMSRSHEATLSQLDRNGPLSTAALAERERLRPQTMGGIVRDLVARGLAEKSPDPSDGRREFVSLTDDGRSAMARVNLERDRDLGALIARELAEDERRELARALALLEALGVRP